MNSGLAMHFPACLLSIALLPAGAPFHMYGADGYQDSGLARKPDKQHTHTQKHVLSHHTDIAFISEMDGQQLL